MTAESPATDQEMPAPPELTEAQERTIHETVCAVVASTVLERPADDLDATLAGASCQNLMGCFVTLKRQGHLRGCCGSVSQPYSLFRTLCEVATTTATQDVRMPAISPTELEFLDVTVSLLYGFRPLISHGSARSAEVTIGKHGLRIQRGSSAGLLLPEVALEHGLDATAFLRQVCRKAGLAADAWQDDDSRILTFRTHCIQAPFSKAAIPTNIRPVSPVGDTNQLEQLGQLSRTNLLALLSGATPSYYAPDCADGTVQGLALHWGAAQGEPTSVGSISLRPGIPLQSTLFNLCQSAAQACAQQYSSVDEVSQLQLDVSVLTDPSVHGTVAAHDLRGMDPQRRGLLVTEAGKTAWVYDPQVTPQDLLDRSAKLAQIIEPDNAQVVSVSVQTTGRAASFSTVPAPQSGGAIRPVGVAGQFYPADAAELDELVDALLGQHRSSSEDVPAILVPHAGLKFSGAIAAAVFRRIKIPSRVIVIGPKHTRLGVDWAVTPHDRWSIGGHTIEADPELAGRLSAAIPGLELDAAAHAREHCIEVELPFLARLAPESRVVGVAMGIGNLERCETFANGLASVIESLQPRPLLVISSDMNHFADDAENRRRDDMALRAMETLDPQHLYRTVMGERISMCGVVPAVAVMMALQKLGGLNRCERVAYATSADAGGDKSRVVGYAGVVLS